MTFFFFGFGCLCLLLSQFRDLLLSWLLMMTSDHPCPLSCTAALTITLKQGGEARVLCIANSRYKLAWLFFVESLPCSIPVSFSSPLPSPFLYSFLLFFLPLPLDLHLHQHCHLRPRRGKERRGFCILLSFNHLILFLLLLQWNICQSLNLCEHWLIMKMILNYSYV